MKIERGPLEGLVIIHPDIHHDNRGYFFESFNEAKLKEYGVPPASEFVQDNQSMSKLRTLRGMHMQKDCGKLVRVISGEVLDAVIDLRPLSPTYRKTFLIWLTEENKTMMWIPPGFAHGFVALKNKTIFCYKVTKYYKPEDEIGINPRDKELNINWGGLKIADVISEKDKALPTLKELEEKNILGPGSLRDKEVLEEEKKAKEEIDPFKKVMEILEEESKTATELEGEDQDNNNDEGQNNREELILPGHDKYSAKEYEIAPESEQKVN